MADVLSPRVDPNHSALAFEVSIFPELQFCFVLMSVLDDFSAGFETVHLFPCCKTSLPRFQQQKATPLSIRQTFSWSSAKAPGVFFLAIFCITSDIRVKLNQHQLRRFQLLGQIADCECVWTAIARTNNERPMDSDLNKWLWRLLKNPARPKLLCCEHIWTQGPRASSWTHHCSLGSWQNMSKVWLGMLKKHILHHTTHATNADKTKIRIV